jgi:phage gp46-like protein
MSDTSTSWIPALGRGDWVLNGAQLQAGSDLQTSLLISLFTDREAEPDDQIPDGTTNPRGWWGDAGQPYKIGSRLWLLARAKQSKDTLERANKYIAEALKWFLDDGVVARFDITTEWTRSSQLGAKVVAYRNDGTSMALNFASVWKGIS